MTRETAMMKIVVSVLLLIGGVASCLGAELSQIALAEAPAILQGSDSGRKAMLFRQLNGDWRGSQFGIYRPDELDALFGFCGEIAAGFDWGKYLGRPPGELWNLPPKEREKLSLATYALTLLAEGCLIENETALRYRERVEKSDSIKLAAAWKELLEKGKLDIARSQAMKMIAVPWREQMPVMLAILKQQNYLKDKASRYYLMLFANPANKELHRQARADFPATDSLRVWLERNWRSLPDETSPLQPSLKELLIELHLALFGPEVCGKWLNQLNRENLPESAQAILNAYRQERHIKPVRVADPRALTSEEIIRILENEDIAGIATSHSQHIYITLKDGRNFTGVFRAADVSILHWEYQGFGDILNLAMQIKKKRQAEWRVMCE